MDNTEEVIYKVRDIITELIAAKNREEWLRLKTSNKKKSNFNKQEKKLKKQDKARQFQEAHVKLRHKARQWG